MSDSGAGRSNDGSNKCGGIHRLPALQEVLEIRPGRPRIALVRNGGRDLGARARRHDLHDPEVEIPHHVAQHQIIAGVRAKGKAFIGKPDGALTGVNELREALATTSPVSARHANGYSQDSGLSPTDDRRAHRRESRRGPLPGSGNGSAAASAVAILDSLKVGIDDDSTRLGVDSSLLNSSAKSAQSAAASPVSPPYAS